MKILIYGAGVIGSLYAVHFSKAGHRVGVYARGRRLQELREHGLRYWDGKAVKIAGVEVLDQVEDADHYDFIFLTVRADQVKTALHELHDNVSQTIVTMVNTVENQQEWETLCGAGRILPAFPGAGGGFRDGILEAGLTPRIIQPTTFGEFGGGNTLRAKQLKALFRSAKIPCQIVRDMHAWQLSHLGMVVPIADAYYMTDTPERVHQDKAIMQRTAAKIRDNFRELYRRNMLAPAKFHLVRLCPRWLLTLILTAVYRSHFGEVFMYRHAIKAPQEMQQLHQEFAIYMQHKF